MILPGFPQFIPNSIPVGGANLTAGTLTTESVDEIGFISSTLRAVYDNPGPTVGVLSPVPDISKTWLGLNTAGSPGDVSIKVTLGGDQTGYFTSRNLVIDGIEYESTDIMFIEFYTPGDDFTVFLWSGQTTPFVDGESYSISIT